jgi:hypothetical protein
MHPGVKPEELSHAILVAILMHHGGSMDIPAEAFQADAMGGPDGAFHAVAMEPRTDGTLRISVQPRPAGDEGGVTTI